MLYLYTPTHTKMKSTLILLFSSIAILISTEVSAQQPLNIDIRVGGNIANYGGEKTDSHMGYMGGLILQYNLPTGLFFQSGIEYTTKGGKWRMHETDRVNFKETLSPQYLQFPLHAGYRVELDAFNFCISAGAYYAYGLGGKIERKYYLPEEGINSKSDFFKTYDKHDFGLGIELTAEFGNLNISFGHDFGLIPLNRRVDNRDYKFKNRNIYLAVGYTVF